MAKKDLDKAKKNKKDEFYTQYCDIEKEIEQYYNYNNFVFKDKVIFLPCDDPKFSNFTKYFVKNFERFGIKKLISTCIENTSDNKNTDKDYKKGKGKIFILDKENLNNNIDINNLTFNYLESNGDFRNKEIKEIRNIADIIITNPPFSLFREFFNWIMNGKEEKEFLIIGNINCITYKEIFEKIKENKIWLGTGLGRWISGFIVPSDYELYGSETKVNDNNERIIATNNCLWLTNLDHGKRHSFIELKTMEENLKSNKTLINKLKKNYDCETYPKYDNYDAIEVPFTEAIPMDYDGVVGVPITFLDKYNPNQFEIIKFRKGNDEKDLCIKGKSPYFRILIQKI